jgi:hypothetical protein
MWFATFNSYVLRQYSNVGFFDFYEFNSTSRLIFCDLFFIGDIFTRFCAHLSSFIKLQKLTFQFINNLNKPLSNSYETKLFFTVLINLPNLKIIEFLDDNSLSKLPDQKFEHFLENLMQLNGIKIKLIRNNFSKQQVQIIRNIEQKYANQILLYLNFTKIFEKLKIPQEIEKNVIKLFMYNNKQQDFFSRVEKKLKEQRLIKSCFFFDMIRRMNESSEFDNYAFNHGGKAKAGALISIDVPRGTKLNYVKLRNLN